MADLVETYLATWNERDGDARRGLLEKHWIAGAIYVDPMAEAAGLDAIDATIEAVHGQFPDYVFALVGQPDAHHSQVRFQWGLGPQGEEPVVVGFDVLLADGEQIARVAGFIDKMPG